MGRILRVGANDQVNYVLQATSNYDADNPAATTFTWPNSALMDQAFDEPSPDEIESEGVLVNFSRFPYAFEGAMVKIRPTYDADTENPFFEEWTHDSVEDEWTLRRRIQLSNLFVGVESGERKIIDFTFFPFLQNVDKVWLTMTATSGSPTNRFIAVHLFGQCKNTLVIPRRPFPGGAETPCLKHPDGLDQDGNPCLVPGADCSQFPEFCRPIPDVDLCNPASVAVYQEALRSIPGALEQFESWYSANATLIAQACAGVDFPNPPPTPPSPPLPPLPPLDLCDEDSIDAFRAAIAGDAEQVAAFDDFLDGLDEAGYFDLTCPPPEPPEQYVDPETQAPAEDPLTDDNTPFASGPGGQPAPGATPLPDDSSDDGGSDAGAVIEITQRSILVWSGNDITEAETLTDALIDPLPAPSEFQERTTESANWGPDEGEATTGLNFNPTVYGFVVRLRKLPFSCRVSLRMRVFRMRTTVAHPTNELYDSISDDGIHTRAAGGGCPAGPDWILTLPESITESDNPTIGDDYAEYVFNGDGLVNNTTINIAVPRVNAAQNDALVCSPGFEPRSDPVEGVAWERGGCLGGGSGPIERDRWVLNNANADFDASGVLDYSHVRPICIVFDVRLDAVVFGKGVDLRRSSIELSTLSDTSPTEDCT